MAIGLVKGLRLNGESEGCGARCAKRQYGYRNQSAQLLQAFSAGEIPDAALRFYPATLDK